METTQDKSYYNAQQIKECLDNGITPYVVEPDKLTRTRLQGRFTRDSFKYEKEINAYRCPAGQLITYQSSYMDRCKRIIWRYQNPTSICANCSLKKQCLPPKRSIRVIARWEHEEIMECHLEPDGFVPGGDPAKGRDLRGEWLKYKSTGKTLSLLIRKPSALISDTIKSNNYLFG